MDNKRKVLLSAIFSASSLNGQISKATSCSREGLSTLQKIGLTAASIHMGDYSGNCGREIVVLEDFDEAIQDFNSCCGNVGCTCNAVCGNNGTC